MISDVLFEALREIDSYMDGVNSLYQGETRQVVDELRAHMNGVLLFLDTPPEYRGRLSKEQIVKPALENETRK